MSAVEKFNESFKIKNLSDRDLIDQVTKLVREERQIIENLIWHLQEIQDRRLFISMGYTSLFECLVKHFGYSEAVAYSRISALRMISAVLKAAQALNNGEVTLTTLSLAQSFIRKQEKESGERFSAQEKSHYLSVIKNKSTKEVKETLAAINPAVELPKDKVIYLSATDIQLQITTDKRLLEKIEKVKSLISHENIDLTYHELLHQAFDALIEKKEKSKGLVQAKRSLNLSAVSKQKEKVTAAAKKENGEITQGFAVKSDAKAFRESVLGSFKKTNENSRYISRSIKRNILERSLGQCEYRHSDGRRCDSTFQLQFDHIKAFSHGGKSEQDNLQVLCRAHNAEKGNS